MAAWHRERFGRRGILAWTLALLLHLAAGFALLHPIDEARRASVADAAPRRTFTVRLWRPTPPSPSPSPPQPESEHVAPLPATPARDRIAVRRRGTPSVAPAPAAASDVVVNGAAPMPTPAASDPGAPRFDRAAASRTVREFAAELNARPGAAAEWQPTRDEKLGRAIERSRKPDCRTAYAGAGLFAPLLLARDAVTDKGCKW